METTINKENQMKRKMKRTRVLIAALLAALALFPGTRLFAQQSFFMSPGTILENGKIARGYCLEYDRPVLEAGNFGKLTRISGLVDVLYKNGETRQAAVAELWGKELIVTPLHSSQYVKISLADTIKSIGVTGEGIVLKRGQADTSEDEERLIEANRRLITGLQLSGESHQTAQNAAWSNKVSEKVEDEKTKTILINFHTSPLRQELRGTYGENAEVLYTLAETLYRFDGTTANTDSDGKLIHDFTTHFHSDHIDLREIIEMYRSGVNHPLYFPLPTRDRSMQHHAFAEMQSLVETGKYDFDIQNFVCSLMPNGMPLKSPVINSTIGQFLYSKYIFEGLTIETYKYLNPLDANADGLIYRITYKNVSQLLLGDFDNEKALTDLLVHSEENQRERLKLIEELYDLEGQKHNGAEMAERTAEIRNKLALLPIIRADVVKWPHHAHLITNQELVEKMNRVMNPRYFIYQPHNKQSLKDFKDFIDTVPFREKFINSAEYTVDILSFEFQQAVKKCV